MIRLSSSQLLHMVTKDDITMYVCTLAETSAVNPLSLSYRTGFTAERHLYLFSGEIFKCAKVHNPIPPAF